MPVDERPAVVTVAHGRHEHLLRQAAVLREVAPDVEHVVVAMDDHEIRGLLARSRRTSVLDLPGTPLGLPLAAARNLGVSRALADGAGLVVLLDVDCLPGPHLLTRYEEAAGEAPGDLLCGPVTYLAPDDRPRTVHELPPLTDPHPVRPAPADDELVRGGDHDLFWSLSFAVTAGTWRRLGGFCEEYVGYGGEDTDLGWSARAKGVGLTWVGGAHAYHQWHPVSSPPVEHVDDVVRNARIAHARWGRWPMRGWLDAFAQAGLVRWGDDGPVVARADPSTGS